jgi:pantoate--beta-alanine ligase
MASAPVAWEAPLPRQVIGLRGEVTRREPCSSLSSQAGADVAIIGGKDRQQVPLVRRVLADPDLPIAILAHPPMREADGPACSSRDIRLTPAQRALAPMLPRPARC